MPDALTILKEDPRFAGLLSYDKLRKLGLDHIASFSGKIWTDHNTHDPGITILELLCYALTDLGYRTRLNIDEIVAPASSAELEDNFFTAEEILTVNPLTILDYRKMLVDIAGVRNAWLVPATRQEVSLYTGCEINSLSYAQRDIDPNSCEEQLVTVEEISREVVLNGLYNVYLDIDPVAAAVGGECEQEGLQVASILKEVKARLHRHRNLCEDFLEVNVLKDEEIGVCGDIELEANANPGEVLSRIYDAIEQFISPRLQFYSLQQMLEQGKSIEAIFEGRPYTLDYQTTSGQNGLPRFSHGFVDVDQLKEQELPTTLFASDFYRIIMAVDGVRAIRSLYLSNFLAGNVQTSGEEWILHLTRNHRPIFAPERSVFNFHKGPIRLSVSNKQQVNERFKRRLSNFQKSKYPGQDLDLSIPYGTHREDMGDYYSIQNEFPLVYRIGEGQMPASASDERKVQALQLKSYLAFFDQLLANYLSQLANIRQLFSRRQAGESLMATYFSQGLDSLPDANRVFRYFQKATDGEATSETLAESTGFFSHPVERDLAIQRLISSFKNASTEQQEQRIQITETNGQYRFSILDNNLQEALVSSNAYTGEREARLAAQAVLFLGLFSESYQLQNWPPQQAYSFSIVDNPPRYESYLSSIGENRQQYQNRRDQMLNHLLARFGEQFTEYVLLMYALNQEQADKEKIINDKASFLNNYPAIGRNRGKGYDYTWSEELWDTKENVSGVEQRVGALMGLENWERRNLNNFEVILREQKKIYCILDHRADVILEINSPCVGEFNIDDIESYLCERTNYKSVDCSLEGLYGLQLTDGKGNVLGVFKRTFGTAAEREEYKACMFQYFCEPLNWLIHTSEREDGVAFLFENESGEILLESIEVYVSEKEAMKAARKIGEAARSTEQQLYFYNSPNSDSKGYGFRVRQTEKLSDPGAVVAKFPTVFERKEQRDTQRNALKQFTNALLPRSSGIQLRLLSTEEGYYFLLLADDDETIYFKSFHSYPTRESACAAWLVFVPLVRQPQHYVALTGNFDGGPYSFGISTLPEDDSEILAYHPAGFTTDSARDLKQKQLQGYVNGKELLFEIEKTPDTYDWNFFGQGDTPLLKSVHQFKTEEQAELAWQAFLPYSTTLENYRVDPHPESGFQITIIKEEGGAIAASGLYEKWSDAKEARDHLFALFSEEEAEAGRHEVGCINGDYYFVILDGQGEIGLIGTHTYSTHEDAACAFYYFTAHAADSNNYREVIEEGTCWYSFEVVVEEEALAYHPRHYIEEEKVVVQEKLITHIDENRLHLSIINLPNTWHFEIWWQSCEGKCERLLVGTETFDTPMAAKTAARELLEQHCANNEASELLLVSNEQGYSFVWKVEGVIEAEHPANYPSEEESNRILEDARAYLEHYCELLNSEGEHDFIKEKYKWHICGLSPDVCDENVEQEELPDNCLLSTFRLTKPAPPLAKHPKVYHSRQERNTAKEHLYQLARCKTEEPAACMQEGKLAFTGLCLQGGKLVRKVGDAYHYELWVAHPDPYLMWRSVKSYQSEEDALAAFQENWLEIVRLSKKQQNYQTPTAEAPFLYLIKEEERITYFPEELSTADEWYAAIEDRQNSALCYPIVKQGKGYGFQIPEDHNLQQNLWESYTVYDSVEEARAAFQHLLNLLQYEGNYQCVDVAEACLFYIEIREVMLEGQKAYADCFEENRMAAGSKMLDGKSEIDLNAVFEDAQQITYTQAGRRIKTIKVNGKKQYQFQIIDKSTKPRQLLWNSAQLYESRSEANSAFQNQYINILQLSVEGGSFEVRQDESTEEYRLYLIGKAGQLVAYADLDDSEAENPKDKKELLKNFALRFPYRKNTIGQYSFQIANSEVGWQSARTYSSLEKANTDFHRFLQWLTIYDTYKVEPTEEGKYQYVLKKLLHQDDRQEDQQVVHKDYEAYPIISGREYITIGQERVKLKEYRKRKGEPAPENVIEICPAAWDKGLQDFLIYAIDETLYYPYLDIRNGCHYSFRVVTDKYRIARSLEEAHTPVAREQLRNWLYGQSRCSKSPILEVPKPEVFEHNGRCYYYLEDEGGNILWRSYQGYDSRQSAEQAFNRAIVSLFSYAQELDFYELIKHAGEDGTTSYQIGLLNRQRQILAVSCELFAEAEDEEENPWNAAILQRLLYARRFPYFEYGGKYGFQCFSTEPMPDFTAEPEGLCLPEWPEVAADECPELPSGLIDVAVSGEVIWESIHEYDSLEETICVFETFYRCLLPDLDNYQRIRFEDCNLFGIEVTHPGEVLAFHPNTYDSYNDMLAAIERAQACINTEGFHLVEHILLRPKEGADAAYVLQLCWEQPLFPPTQECAEPPTRKIWYLLDKDSYNADEEEAAKNDFMEKVREALEKQGGDTIADCYEPLRKLLSQQLGMSARNIEVLLNVMFGFSTTPTEEMLSAEKPEHDELIGRLRDKIALRNQNEGHTADPLIPNCPDCCYAEALPAEEAKEGACNDPKALLKAQIDGCDRSELSLPDEVKPTVEWYIPGADPYSFWVTVALPYWPERFQNINFRRFFEDTLRREFPAHIGIRICWLDPKQMLHFEHCYRSWLEAFSGNENCNLKEAQACLIDILFSMTTVYPPAQLKGGDCGAGSGDPNAVLLDYTQLS